MGGDLLDWFGDHAMPWLILLVIVGACVFVPVYAYSAYKQSKSPSFTLYKNQWACTNIQKVSVTTYVKSGDVMIPVTNYVDVCHQWSRQP